MAGLVESVGVGRGRAGPVPTVDLAGQVGPRGRGAEGKGVVSETPSYNICSLPCMTSGLRDLLQLVRVDDTVYMSWEAKVSQFLHLVRNRRLRFHIASHARAAPPLLDVHIPLGIISLFSCSADVAQGFTFSSPPSTMTAASSCN